MTTTEAMTDYADLAVGDQIRFDPQGGNRWWAVLARNERFVVATYPAPFHTTRLRYAVFVTDGLGYVYNGQGPGPVRTSLDTLGGGWDVGPDGVYADEVITALETGEWGLSHRRLLNVDSVERKVVKEPSSV